MTFRVINRRENTENVNEMQVCRGKKAEDESATINMPATPD